MLGVLVTGCCAAGCSQTPNLMPDLSPPTRQTLTPDEQQKAIQAMAARKAAQDALVTAEIGASKR